MYENNSNRKNGTRPFPFEFPLGHTSSRFLLGLLMFVWVRSLCLLVLLHIYLGWQCSRLECSQIMPGHGHGTNLEEGRAIPGIECI